MSLRLPEETEGEGIHELFSAERSVCDSDRFSVPVVCRGKVFKAATNSARKRITANMLRKEALRDRALFVKPLGKPLKVHRFVPNKKELKTGIEPNRHMTPQAKPGRPPSAETAQKQYGLPTKPRYRETIELPAGQEVRRGKAMYGEPGRGEITSPQSIGKEQIKNITRLP